VLQRMLETFCVRPNHRRPVPLNTALDGTPVDASTILWQQRRRSDRPVSIRNGCESAWSGSTTELLSSAHSVTLLTRAGSEVIVGHLEPLAGGCWKGVILKFAPGAGHLR
jgi:hypothetical protein